VLKDYTLLVETCNGVINFLHIVIIKNRTADKVAEFYKAANCVHHLWWDMAQNRRKVHLIYVKPFILTIITKDQTHIPL